MGVPGICPAVGGIPEILRDRGWLTQPDDQASLEAALTSALDHPAAVSALDEPCREYVRSHFDAERISQRYHAILTG